MYNIHFSPRNITYCYDFLNECFGSETAYLICGISVLNDLPLTALVETDKDVAGHLIS